jgi:hypothetical protein
MDAIKPKPGITLDELKRTEEFRRLRPKMANWVIVYIQGHITTGFFDHRAATKAAYVCANDESARVFGHRLKQNPKVRAVVALYLRKSPRELLLEEVQQHLAACDPGSVAGQRLLAQKERLLFGTDPATFEEADETQPSPDVRVPAGATPLADDVGVIRGYRLPSGDYVRLVDGAAEIDGR